ncbi:nuclear transport factor 2 family protein [Flagellimonas meridianipacifica]|uniref:Putative SnoaL-like aldol condensation-catalyzing enzyme n=1 Tax=Flagellimonas meridianipacifica TaxID=1080225 RepID=A0A2T0MI52_9FLAO|nr:nuclear transport factor 2 family protein [Allomuricauda pacifica]PRX57254.1 putative SnoaL-like aldol condensation-catalyzing enzyme [Allomuricauda pacifica]
MNEEHPNIRILNKFDPANPKTIANLLAEDFVWHYINPELPDVQGDYHGSSGLIDFFKKLAVGTNGSFKVNPLSAFPMGDELVITHVKDTMILDGESMEIEAVVLWCIIDGKIKEAWDIPISHTATFK